MTKLKAFLFALLFVAFAIGPVSAQNSEKLDSIKLSNFYGVSRYAIGLSTQMRQAQSNINLGIKQEFWRAYNVGVSVLRYTNPRFFWTAGLGFTTVNLDQERGPDIRYILNPTTNQYEETNLGTRTEKRKYRYFSLPIGFNYKVFDSNRTNLYISGSVILDWLHRYKREIDATYDGRLDRVYRGKFNDVSTTLRGGVGLYQPIGSHFVLLAGPYLGYSLLSDFEKDAQSRGNYSLLTFDAALLYRLP